MTPRRRKSRVYWRAGRAWFDGRDYAEVGGKQEPLVAVGERLATRDADVAQSLATARLRELEQLRRDRGLHGRRERAKLAAFAAHHLVEKKRAGKVTDGWLEVAEVFLRRAIEFLGADRELESIRVSDVRAWIEKLTAMRSHGGRTLSGGTVRHHLNTLSNLFRRAQEAEVVPPGWNPVTALMEKPSGRRLEARWLEVPDAALFLEAARTLPERPNELGAQVAFPLLATFLLTGGRRSEVLGLELEDVSFGRGTVTFRPNKWRRLKTDNSARVVPLWPQLREILTAYLSARTASMVLHNAPASALLFPSFRTGAEGRLVELRKLFDRVGIRGGWHAGDIRSRALRHSYCATRLQTLDARAPVSLFTVAREMGHGGDSLVRRIYGHLGEVRHRSEAVEYRVEQHTTVLMDRLSRMQAAPA